MGVLHLEYTKGGLNSVIKSDELDKFDVSILGLGDIGKEGVRIESLCCFFDLANFTLFCNQIDSHLVVPEFIEKYLKWFFEKLKSEHLIQDKGEDELPDDVKAIWGCLPFCAKFLGDGLLLIWDVDKLENKNGVGNIVSVIRALCQCYISEFVSKEASNFVGIPPVLRCGIARGQIISIGDGSDYVGSCINMAARLQKMPGLSFAISRRGFDPNRCFSEENQSQYIAVKTSIRGISEGEIILINKSEYEGLNAESKKMYVLNGK